MPQLIEAGKVYKAVPPLYSLPVGKGKNKLMYFTQQIDFVRYNQKNFTQKHTLKYTGKDGKNLTSRELTQLFLVNEDYVYEMNRISKTYAMDPILLETVLLYHYNKKSPAVLKKKIKSTYRFMDMTKRNGVDIIDGTIDKSYRLYITDRLIEDCSAIFDIIKDNKECYYNMDGKEASLYEIMNEYEKCVPSDLQRYKGLGEMDYNELSESTLDPFSERSLVKYTMDDAKEEIEAIRVYESKLSKLLDLVGKVNRQDLLD